jgi:hypothetical protein
VDGIIDRFGEEVDTIIIDKEHLSVKTTVSLSGTFFGWVGIIRRENEADGSRPCCGAIPYPYQSIHIINTSNIQGVRLFELLQAEGYAKTYPCDFFCYYRAP